VLSIRFDPLLIRKGRLNPRSVTIESLRDRDRLNWLSGRDVPEQYTESWQDRIMKAVRGPLFMILSCHDSVFCRFFLSVQSEIRG